MRKVTAYSEAIKATVLTKAMAPNAAGVVELAKEFNIPYATIYTWKKLMLNNQPIKQVNTAKRPNDKSPEAKLRAVLDTIGKTEQEQSAYCREQGIYSNHIDAWKKQMLEGLGSFVNIKELKAENQQVTTENKQLKQDLKCKDKALAEISALLILKKKAALFWGEDKDA